MPNYLVRANREIWEHVDLEITADDEEQACAKAYEIATEDKDLEWQAGDQEGDVEIDDAEEIPEENDGQTIVLGQASERGEARS